MAHLRSSALVRSRDGQFFLTAQALDSLASGLATVALPWFVLDGGGSVGEAGLVWAGQMLPYVVFGLPAGVVADRLRRRLVIASAHLAQALAALLVPLAVWLSGAAPLWLVLLSAFLIGGARAFSDGGAFGAIATLVGEGGFAVGQSVLNVAWSLGWIVGPALGGFVIAHASPTSALTLQAACFAFATGAILLVRRSLDPPPDPDAVHEPPVAALLGGLRFIRDDEVVRTLTMVGIAYNVMLAGSYALIVPLLREEMSFDARQTGWILGIGSAVGLATPLVVAPLARRYPGTVIFHAAMVLVNVTTGLLALASGFWPVLAIYVVGSAGQWVEMAMFIGERQKRAPHELQARVGLSGRMVMTATLAIGSLAGSAVAEAIGLRATFAAMSIAGIVIAILTTRLVIRLGRLSPALT